MTCRHSTFLFALLGTVCASDVIPAQDPGYRLRLHGDEVALSLQRGLAVPEFLQLAEQVTSTVYTCRAAAIAGCEPITLTGQIQCDRARFGDFVQTMLYLRGLCVAPSASHGALEVKSTSPCRRPDSGYDLELQGDRVALSVHRGLSVPEFLELAEQVTSTVYLCRPAEIVGSESIMLTGRVQCDRASFGDFVQTMLYLRGLTVAPSAAEQGALEVRSRLPQRSKKARRESV